MRRGRRIVGARGRVGLIARCRGSRSDRGQVGRIRIFETRGRTAPTRSLKVRKSRELEHPTRQTAGQDLPDPGVEAKQGVEGLHHKVDTFRVAAAVQDPGVVVEEAGAGHGHRRA